MQELSPSIKGKFTRLANLKKEIKKLETEAKHIQALIFERVKDPPKTVVVKQKEMSLCLSARENWSTPDNHAVIAVIGMEMFMKHAVITKAKIEKAGGEEAVSVLHNRGELSVKSVTRYYSLKTRC